MFAKLASPFMLMQVTIKTFQMNIKLPVHNDSRLFSEMRVLQNQIKQTGVIFLKHIHKTYSIQISIFIQMLI